MTKALTIAEAYKTKAKAEGKIEGKIEGKTEVAINMLKAGMNTKIVAELTGLELAMIEELKHS